MSTTLSTLYSRTALGQIQQWTIEVEGADYRTHEGIMGGAITTSAWTRAEPKNVGRANESRAEEQALKEARSRHKKKRDKGYHESVEDIDKVTFFEPMLAHKWQDYGDDVELPVCSQVKLDGSRLIVSSSGPCSRTGKPVAAAPHIVEALAPVFVKHPKLVLDGELYNHDLKHDFDTLMSLSRVAKPTPEDLAASREKLQYWVYDCDDGTGKTFAERSALLKEVLAGLPPCIHIVETHWAEDQAELDALYEQYLEEGYEGQMVRDPKSVYEHKRTKALLKRKEMQDAEWALIDVLPGRGNRANMAAKVVCALLDGRTFEAGMIGSHEYCERLLREKDKHIGKMATIQYFCLTPAGIPRFGKMKAIREAGE